MRTIHCIAFDPDNGDVGGCVGGTEWRVRHDAIEQLYLQFVQDPEYNHCRITRFEIRVPEWAPNHEISELVDLKAWAEDYVVIARRDPKVTT